MKIVGLSWFKLQFICFLSFVGHDLGKPTAPTDLCSAGSVLSGLFAHFPRQRTWAEEIFISVRENTRRAREPEHMRWCRGGFQAPSSRRRDTP